MATKTKNYRYYARQTIKRIELELLTIEEGSRLWFAKKAEIGRQKDALKMTTAERNRCADVWETYPQVLSDIE